MKRIDEIKAARQARFWQKRMDLAKEQKKKGIVRELEKHVDLIDDETVKGKILENLEVKRQKQIDNNNRMRKKVVANSDEEMDVEVIKIKKRYANKPTAKSIAEKAARTKSKAARAKSATAKPATAK
jgi:hypothetical protein